MGGLGGRGDAGMRLMRRARSGDPYGEWGQQRLGGDVEVAVESSATWPWGTYAVLALVLW